MPPKRRGRPAAAEAAQPETVSDHEGEGDADGAAAAASDQGEGSDPDVSHGEAESTSFKFFNTTFSTFRVSPLYTGKNPLTTAGLQTLSRRLRDTLVGDVVRGVQVGLESDTTLGRLGTLDSVEWREYDPGTLFPTLTDEGKTSRQRHDGIRNGKKKGKGKDTGAQTEQVQQILCLKLEYEKASFNALLLPSLNDRENQDGNGTQDEDRPQPSWTRHDAKGKATEDRNEDTDSAFARYPLLLTRMPAPLKTVLVDFLSSTFDCRISHLHLGTRTLVRSWERWIEESGAGTGEGKMPDKDVALTLGFHLEPPSPVVLDGTMTSSTTPDGRQGVQEALAKPTVLGLKTMDIVVPSEEIRRFLRVGKRNGSTPTDNGGKGYATSGGNRKRPAASSTISDDERDRLQRRKLGGGKDEEGWTWRQGPRQHQIQEPNEDDIHDNGNRRTGETFPQPFTDALSHYLDHHLALDMTHPGVRVLRVVCDAFALSDTRLKVFAPRDRGEVRINDGGENDLSRSDSGSGALAIDTFLRSLVRKAQGPEWGQRALKLANLEVLG
ncbi:hypothetical protein NPX13_g8104 [Xylaria arbuscula]|uniref:Uncharacterized protein n=1 Tax=Xylaria arbuscula TaxID=114810 RepID=A0A9W8TJS1_9PEZI|nr:hypothetical protein NPX13_g8104 [Xylaria arbuscula]